MIEVQCNVDRRRTRTIRTVTHLINTINIFGIATTTTASFPVVKLAKRHQNIKLFWILIRQES